MNVVLLGPQGAGKGTQAALLVERTGLVHVASGDVVRAAIREGTALGLEAKRYYDAGELVPDTLIIGMLLEVIATVAPGRDVLLDGFPRTVVQAEALDAALAEAGEGIDLVIELRLPLDTAKERLSGRLICRVCGEVYNERTRPPKAPGICDNDGGELYRRADDYPEAIEKRLRIWESENTPLVAYFGRRGIVREVDAARTPEVIAVELVALLESRASSSP